jgi:DUF438 domain-containing protein
VEKITICYAILDSLVEEIVFVDTEHIIRYMNPAGKKHYASRGGAVGKSLFACHNEQSVTRIKDLFDELKAGTEEVLYIDTKQHRVYMRAVRDQSGNLVGYYERYAPPRAFSD